MSTSLVLGAARRSWWIGVLCAVVGMGSALLAASVTTPEWTATATLTVRGPDVQDTSTGFLVTEMAATSGAALVSRTGFIADTPQDGRSERDPQISASVPFSTSNVVIMATADDRDAAVAAAGIAARRVSSRITSVAAHIAISPAEQRVATVLPVRLRLLGAPSASEAPTSPQVGLNLVAGAAAGLALGVAVALLQQLLDPSSGSTPRARRAAPRGADRGSARRLLRSGHRPRGAHVLTSAVLALPIARDEGRQAW